MMFIRTQDHDWASPYLPHELYFLGVQSHTWENKDKERCLVDDVNDAEEMSRLLEEAKSYVGEAQFELLHNLERFNPNEFGPGAKSNLSKVVTR